MYDTLDCRLGAWYSNKLDCDLSSLRYCTACWYSAADSEHSGHPVQPVHMVSLISYYLFYCVVSHSTVFITLNLYFYPADPKHRSGGWMDGWIVDLLVIRDFPERLNVRQMRSWTNQMARI